MTKTDGGASSPRPLRVLHLLLWITPTGGGIQTYLRGLLRAFQGSSDVSFLGIAVGPGEQPPGFVAPVQLGLATRSRWHNFFRFALHVLRAARGADLVQIHGIFGAQFFVGAPLCWLVRAPYIVMPHNALAPWMLEQKAWKKGLFFGTVGGFFLRRAICVLGTSVPEVEFIVQRFRGVRVRLVLAGVEVPEEPQVEMLRNSPASGLRLLYLGSFEPWKRVPMLVRAVAALRTEGVDVELVIAGQGPARLEQTVDDEIAKHGLGDVVRRVGYVGGDRKFELIRQAHVLAQPSATDSYSIATAEALSQGLPVVITEGAGAAPDVRAYECGTVVPVDHEAAFVAALRKYAEPAYRQLRALNAHAYARSKLALPVLRSGMTALYRELTTAGTVSSI